MTRFPLALLALLSGSGVALAGGPYALQAPVLAADGATSNLLGFAVAASPTLGTVDNPSFAIAGTVGIAAYIYTAPLPGSVNGNFSNPSRLTSGVANDLFGLSVAIIGSGNAAVAAVGAPGDDSGGGVNDNFGLVYLYTRTSGSWTLAGTLTPPIAHLTGNFGNALVSNGSDTLFVGEPKALTSGEETGAVHVYQVVGGALQLQTTLRNPGPPGRRFGQSVAFSGNTLVIGAPLDDQGATLDTGSLLVYTGSGASWTLQAQLLADDFANGDRLGLSVAIDGDTLIGGAGNDDKPAGAEAGSAYVFTRSGTTWTQQAKLRSTQAQVQERFGNTVSLQGSEAMVGAYCLSTGGCTGPGAVYVFNRLGSDWSLRQRISSAPGANGDSFGHSVAHGPGHYVIAGAFGVDGPGGNDQGAIYALTTIDAVFANGFEDPL